MAEQNGTNRPQAVLTQAGYAAIGAGEAIANYVRTLSKELPERMSVLREQMPGALRQQFEQLANRGRQVTGQVARQTEQKATEPLEPGTPADDPAPQA